jgi:hypothetical protein
VISPFPKPKYTNTIVPWYLDKQYFSFPPSLALEKKRAKPRSPILKKHIFEEYSVLKP